MTKDGIRFWGEFGQNDPPPGVPLHTSGVTQAAFAFRVR